MTEASAGKQHTDAIILAGGTIRDEEFVKAVGVDRRPLIDILGKPMVQWVVEALRGSRHIGRVVVLGPPELQETSAGPLVDAVVDEGADEVDNLYRGIDALRDAARIVMVASDLALLTPAALDDLIENAPPDADVVLPICEKGAIGPELADHEWVYIKTPDGSFTGASCFLLKPEPLLERREWIEEVFDARRSKWRLIRMWGFWFSLRALLHRVTLAQAEAHVSNVVRLHGRAYVTRFPEVCVDVDRLSDVALVAEHLRRRESG
ncbi:MAG: NTP transferase domain-containing protein [Armatimonadota bacterium]